MSIIDSHSHVKQGAQEHFKRLQDDICRAVETIDGKETFTEDHWSHPTAGGGRARMLQDGAIFEKAGVNFSAVAAPLSENLATRLSVPLQNIFATGISLVMHPCSPMVPTVHMNLRYLELADGNAWFGGGADLTPYYLFPEDAQHFHAVWKAICDKYDSSWYPRFKKSCDEYFFISHRKEARGVGGIFFDYLKGDLDQLLEFVQDVGHGILESYIPIVERRRHEPWGEREKEWQKIRRGRYVEFNLIYDRGTLFGLETEGRTESILMSLPPEVKWPYDYRPEAGTREEALVTILQHPREWV
ncbi:MAG: oxygen-dependent coproporphyrinogen oxidase [Ignavibacteria bacterium]|nr:oxygen-dependent coproporphyrinogen oxidase [Ignavibacteria bacterium]MBI3765616.1 oxygen-dependent coproporphyrinogen oxidase [Ignavibacteriales bacterium]